MSHFDMIIGQSPSIESLIRSAKMVAATDVTVLLQGETGTGKEVFANAIQKSSARADKAFITLNCAALPESLIESELFGHKKGSFTGATANTQGLFKAADGGTLFLDEINSLPYSIQAKLLRFLESGECLAIGDIKPYHVDVRIIAATNTDLLNLVTAKEFRADLYYRLNVVPLELPSLSQRSDDIEALINHFMNMMATTHAMESAKLSKPALKALKAYPWPGNIRELRNLCERLCILMAGKTIEFENLPPEFINTFSPPTTSLHLPERGIELDSLEADFIHQALNRTKGNKSKTAKLLGLTRDTLIYRMQKHGLH
ncbi:MAG: AAA family ATPase [Methylococcales bacterium]|nr:MAG: AAA family ATPase [Methylococcales bacterium]